MTAYKRRLQICFRGGSAAGEQQAPHSSSISTMADAEEREEKENKTKTPLPPFRFDHVRLLFLVN